MHFVDLDVEVMYMSYFESVNHLKCEINYRCMKKLNIYPHNPQNHYYY